MSKEVLRFTKTHEWVKLKENQEKIGFIGVTEYLLNQLVGEIISVDFFEVEVGKEIKIGDLLCIIETSEAAAAVFSPLSGEVVNLNKKVQESPSLVKNDPYGEGWLIEMKCSELSEFENLLQPEIYKEIFNLL